MSDQHIFVWGATSTNRGSLAMLETLAQLHPGSKIVFAVDHAEDINLRHDHLYPIDVGQGVVNYIKLFMVVAINLISANCIYHKRLDVKTLRRSSKFVDLSGFALSEDFSKNSCTYRSLIFLLQALISRLVGKSYEIYPQAVGPMRRTVNRMLFFIIVLLADKVYIRGSRSYEFAKSVTRREIIQTSDLVFLNTEYSKRSNNPFDRPFALVSPNSRIYVKEKKAGTEEYFSSLKSIVTRLSTDYLVVLTPTETRATEFDDLDICERIFLELNDRTNVRVNRLVDVPTLLLLCEHCTFALTSRFHLMVFCLMKNSVPVVISWSEKYIDIMERFGLDHLVIDSKQAEVLDYKAVGTVEQKFQISEAKKKIISDMTLKMRL